MIDKQNIKVIAFDADDTLWINEPYYREVEDKFCQLLQEFLPTQKISSELFQTEIKNLPIYGYGIKAFILSVIETALKISNNKISIEKIEEIIKMGKNMLNKPIELIDGIEQVLQTLYEKNYRLIVATKGDLLDQERKLQKSGLEKYFHHIEVMSDKQELNYQKLINHLDISPSEFLMIGNSVKSDIIPILKIGGNAIHVPFHTTWAHEEVKDTNLPNFDSINCITNILDFNL